MHKRLLGLAVPAALAALALTGEARAQLTMGPEAAPVPGPGAPPPTPLPLTGEGPAPFPPPPYAFLPAPPLRPVAPWGLHNGDTVGQGDNLIYGEIGWPDISFGYQRGVSDYADVGFRIQHIFGVEYTIPKK